MTLHSRAASIANADESNRAPALTLVESVRRLAKERPTQRAYVYASAQDAQTLTYGELDRRARAIARRLATQTAPGATALLLYPLGLDFVAAFFGCLYAGVIAVPLHPGRGKVAAERLRSVVRDSGARIALTTSSLSAESLTAAQADLRLVPFATDGIALDREPLDTKTVREPAPGAIAFLQYTSGSTSEPKGTIVTHGNIATNLAMLKSAFGTNESTRIVSWLPIFHDMGLIGNVLHSAYLGATTVLVSTLAFIKSPILWLRTIERYRADFSGAPNFAYDLCVDQTTPEERAGLDLGSWRVAFNGAEPVRARTLERFTAAFSPSGFRKTAFAPTYGLAEATLIVSGDADAPPHVLSVDDRALRARAVAPARGDEPVRPLVSNGRCDLGDQVVAIVDPDSSERCADAVVGEIWVSGSHVAAGYWNNARATAETFGAELPGDPRRYLRTGDLGFLRDGALFVTGRRKDLLIFHGQNVYPQDIELTLELALPEVRAGATAAFASDDDTSGVVIVAELARGPLPGPDRLARAAELVQASHELPLHHLVLVRRSTVPKTTSGKIQRQRCKSEYERGDYAVLAEWRSEALETPAALARRIREFAGDFIAREQGIVRARIRDTAPLGSYGIDSIRKVALVSAIERHFAIAVPESTFFSLDSIEDIVEHATARGDAATPRTSDAPTARERHATVHSAKTARPVFANMRWEDEDE